MPNSLRARVNRLAYKGWLSSVDANRIREALARRTPKKPIYTNEGTVTRCPICEAIHFRCLPSVKVDYCVRCGQAIDWSEVE